MIVILVREFVTILTKPTYMSSGGVRLGLPILIACFIISCSASTDADSESSNHLDVIVSATIVESANTPLKSDQPRLGGTLRVAQPGDPSSCDLHMSRGMSYQAVHPCNAMLSQIIRVDARDHGILLPDLAIHWNVAEDGVTWTFEIRSDASWHDGSAVTTDDLVFSLQRVIDPPPGVSVGRAGSFARYVPNSDMVTMVDDRTLVVRTQYPSASFIANIASVYLSIYPRDVTEALKPPSMVQFDQVVGSGPFMAHSSMRGSSYKMRRNDNYYDSNRPYLDELWYLVMPQPAVRLAALTARQVDMISIITEAEAKTLEREYGENIRVLEAPSAGGNTLQLNTQRAPFDDPRVRRAVNLAISRADASIVLGGGLDGAIMPPGGPWALSGTEVLTLPGMGDKTTEREEAKRLMADAGYPAGLTTTLHTRANPFFRSLASFAAGQLREIGIVADVVAMEPVAYQDMLLRGDHMLIAHSHSFPLDDPDAILPDHYSCRGVENFPRICDIEIDDMIKKQSRELDRDVRKSLVDELQRRIWHLDGKIWFQWSLRRTPIWRNVIGFEIGGPSLYQGRRMEDVWIK